MNGPRHALDPTTWTVTSPTIFALFSEATSLPTAEARQFPHFAPKQADLRNLALIFLPFLRTFPGSASLQQPPKLTSYDSFLPSPQTTRLYQTAVQGRKLGACPGRAKRRNLIEEVFRRHTKLMYKFQKAQSRLAHACKLHKPQR